MSLLKTTLFNIPHSLTLSSEGTITHASRKLLCPWWSFQEAQPACSSSPGDTGQPFRPAPALVPAATSAGPRNGRNVEANRVRTGPWSQHERRSNKRAELLGLRLSWGQSQQGSHRAGDSTVGQWPDSVPRMMGERHIPSPNHEHPL